MSVKVVVVDATTVHSVRVNISSTLHKETFTPFLGAGASSFRPNSLRKSTQWRAARERMATVCNAVEDEDTRKYFLSLLESHGIESGELSAASGQGAVAASEPVLRFQLALTALGAGLLKWFASQVGAKMICPVDPDLLSVEAPNPLGEPLRSRMLDALDRAEACLSYREEGSLPHEVMRNLYRNLIVLAWKLGMGATEFGRHCSAYADVAAVSLLPGNRGQESETISVGLLAWIGDAIWYTLKREVPSYPTTSELAFQLSMLAEPDKEIGRGSLSQVAELVFPGEGDVETVRRQVDRLAGLLEYCEDKLGRPSWDSLHMAVAGAMVDAYAAYVGKWRRQEADEGGVGHGGGNPDDELILPIALTTNYDRALEGALDRLGHSYHVMYPVKRPAGRQHWSYYWSLLTVKKGRAVPVLNDELPQWSAMDLGREIAGPVIVKLHGSPMHPVKEGHVHHVVLSESSYLVELTPEYSWPEWLVRELTKPRDLWFLGYSLADWNVRLRMRIDMLRGAHVQPPQPRLLFGRYPDRWRSAVLSGLGIEACYRGDLDFFSRHLLDDRKIGDVVRLAKAEEDRNG